MVRYGMDPLTMNGNKLSRRVFDTPVETLDIIELQIINSLILMTDVFHLKYR